MSLAVRAYSSCAQTRHSTGRCDVACPPAASRSCAATARLNDSLTDRSLRHRRWTTRCSAPSRWRSRSIAAAAPRVYGRNALRACAVLPAELGRDHEVLRIGARRLCEQLIRDVGAVIPGGIEDPHAKFECSPQNTSRLRHVRWRPVHAGAGQAHRAVAQYEARVVPTSSRRPLRGTTAPESIPNIFKHMLEKIASGRASTDGHGK